MVVFNQHQMHDLDSTPWVDFSTQCDNARNSTFANHNNNKKDFVSVDGTAPQGQYLNNDEMTPPKLSLSLDHYCVIAENVFISFLKSYRTLYSTKRETESVEKTVNDVAVLGNRLEAFLTVVLPFHKEYGTVHRKRETCRIHDMTHQLRDYLEKLTDGHYGILQPGMSCDERNDIGDHHSDNCDDRSDDLSSDSSIFEDIELQNPEKDLNLSVSEDTFCSSEGTALEGVNMLEMSLDEEQSSICHSDTFDTNSGKSWDYCSLMGQVGHNCDDSENHGADDASSFLVSFKNGKSINTTVSLDDAKPSNIPSKVSALVQDRNDDGDDEGTNLLSIPSKVAAQVQDCTDDGDDDKTSRKTRFDLLIKHWREKEREYFNKKNVNPRTNNARNQK